MLNSFFVKHCFIILFLISYSLLYFVGPIINLIIESFGIYKVQGLDFFGAILPALFLLLTVTTYFFIKLFLNSKYFNYHRSANVINNDDKVFSFISLVVFIASSLVYVYKSGFVLFSSGGYENRYSSNIGLGIFSQLLICFYFYYSIQIKDFLTEGTVFKKKTVVLVGVFFCIYTFILLGGHRQLGFGIFFMVAILLLHLRDITIMQLLFFGLLGLFAVLFSAVLRYDIELVGLHEYITIFSIFLFDGITPFNAYSDIYNDVTSFGVVGLTIIRDEFATLIPRFLWSDKPEIIYNAGNYYSQEILGRPDAITYSPTLLGELLLVHGKGLLFISIPLGFLLASLDRILINNSRLSFVLLSLSPLLIFNLYREGFYVFTKRLLLYLIIFLLISFLSKFVSFLIYKKN